ncbi:hypothetical protein HDEF_1402 [Candidatus Hamiltonella defensa 5AT (Acyrthosiphon pisum)]|uniref:Uncharacterized protein n=2 Tax=Candidatus Williamhamiltonella defendens TaxID=138072 RepID=C4K641_HAMD5|nr:hypothetical protein HDEF_1402 [Candidatus Hamiltonella defensa 5AT (Acyrthosiphon pisum)]
MLLSANLMSYETHFILPWPEEETPEDSHIFDSTLFCLQERGMVDKTGEKIIPLIFGHLKCPINGVYFSFFPQTPPRKI